MNSDVVLLKTLKGAEEIKSRAHGLPQRLRTVLILVDGKTSVGQLTARLTAYADLDAILSVLTRDGFVAPATVAAPALNGASRTGPASITGPASVPARAPAVTDPNVRQALIDLCRYLHDHLGPDADTVSVRVEQAATRADFVAAVRRAQAMLQAVAGTPKANQFQARAQAILDTYFADR